MKMDKDKGKKPSEGVIPEVQNERAIPDLRWDFTQILHSNRSFIIFAIAFVFYNTVGTILQVNPRGSDIWEHLAVIHSFARNPIHPPIPFLLSTNPIHLFTPYHLFLGVLARLFHLHPFYLLPFIAGVNSCIFLFSARAFSRTIFTDAKFALPLALTMLFFWFNPWGWSGFYHFGQLPLTSVYPYWFALSISLYLFAKFEKTISPLRLGIFSVSTAIVFLIHSVFGMFLLIGIFAKALMLDSIRLDRKLFHEAVPTMITALLALAWPYYPILDTIIQSGVYEDIMFAGEWSMFYRGAIWRIFPALLGLPYFIYQLVRRKWSFGLIGFILTTAVYFLNYAIFHNTALSRSIIFIAFFCHIGIVETLRECERIKRLKTATAVYLIVALVVAYPHLKLSLSQISPLRKIRHGESEGTIYQRFNNLSEFGKYIEPDDVVIAPMLLSWELAPVLACKLVRIKNSNPFLPDFAERKEATETFFCIATDKTKRDKILSRYSVDFIVVPKDGEADIVDLSGYPRIHENDGYIIYKVK
jgi:hypothetical protein